MADWIDDTELVNIVFLISRSQRDAYCMAWAGFPESVNVDLSRRIDNCH